MEEQQVIIDQKQLEEYLTSNGYTLEEQYKEENILFTKYSKLGIGVRIEQNIPPFYYECINEDCNNTILDKTEDGWQCPNCGCWTVAPEEDGMIRQYK